MLLVILLLFFIVCLLIFFYRIRVQWYLQYKRNSSNLNAEQIYHHLCCYEFPFECFYGINLAFYRTFVSPTISKVYVQTNTIAGETEKRVNDTDIIMHAWVDYGLDSEEGQASIEHLNNIHEVFRNRTRNEDFIYVLCCFIVDTIRMIDVFGWRHLDDNEKQALFIFYQNVGQKMKLDNLPISLEDAYSIVKNYTQSDINSTETESGRILTNAVHTLVQKWYGFLLPTSLIRILLNALLYVVGGEIFHKKLGLKQPSSLSIYVIYALATIRRDLMYFMPPRTTPHRLSDLLMKQKYMCPATKMNFLQVGPPKILASFITTVTCEYHSANINLREDHFLTGHSLYRERLEELMFVNSMDIDLDFCLKRFADEQVIDSIKQITQLERNLERKRTNIAKTVQYDHDNEVICQQENILLKQFSYDLNENNIVINKTRHIIENEFSKALHVIKTDIETIAQILTTRTNNQENNNEIRAAINKIRQQIARIDSELTHLFHIIDCNHSKDFSPRIKQRFRQHYGYANELNRIVGKHSNSDDLFVFSQNSLLMQSIFEHVHLWNVREKLINKFIHQMDEESITSKYLMDSLYRMRDTPSSLKFIQYYLQNRQETRRHRDEHLMHKMTQKLDQQRIEQKTRIIELVNALGQLSVNTVNEFQLNKKLKKVLYQTETSQQMILILTDNNEETPDNLLMIRLEADYNQWKSNEYSIQQRFCTVLCKIMRLPRDTIRIERLEEGSVILHIAIDPPYDQFIIKQISDRENENKSSVSIVQAIQNCCAKFNCRVLSIVSGFYTLPIEKRLMDLKYDNKYTNKPTRFSNASSMDSFDRNNQQSLCPEGWKRFGIKVADNDAVFDAKWGSWHVAYHGSQGFFAPFILTSGLRVLTERYCIPGNQQAIYLSPSIEYAAHPRHTYLWKKVMNNNEKYQYYQLVLQCRVNPAAVGDPTPETLLHETDRTKCIDKDFSNEKLEWIIQTDIASQEYIRDNIVCYGLMIRVIDCEPRDLPTLNWWKDSKCAEY